MEKYTKFLKALTWGGAVCSVCITCGATIPLALLTGVVVAVTAHVNDVYNQHEITENTITNQKTESKNVFLELHYEELQEKVDSLTNQVDHQKGRISTLERQLVINQENTDAAISNLSAEVYSQAISKTGESKSPDQQTENQTIEKNSPTLSQAKSASIHGIFPIPRESTSKEGALHMEPSDSTIRSRGARRFSVVQTSTI